MSDGRQHDQLCPGFQRRIISRIAIRLWSVMRLLNSETDLPVWVAACGELHTKVVRQDRVILHELGKWGPVGLPKTDLHPSPERHGGRNRICVPGPQGKEASACQRDRRQNRPCPHSLAEILGDPMVHPKAFPIGGHLINQFNPVPTTHLLTGTPMPPCSFPLTFLAMSINRIPEVDRKRSERWWGISTKSRC